MSAKTINAKTGDSGLRSPPVKHRFRRSVIKILRLKQADENKKRNAAKAQDFQPGFADNFIFEKFFDFQGISASSLQYRRQGCPLTEYRLPATLS